MGQMINVREWGSMGLITDKAPWDLPFKEIGFCENARWYNNEFSRAKGWVKIPFKYDGTPQEQTFTFSDVPASGTWKATYLDHHTSQNIVSEVINWDDTDIEISSKLNAIRRGGQATIQTTPTTIAVEMILNSAISSFAHQGAEPIFGTQDITLVNATGDPITIGVAETEARITGSLHGYSIIYSSAILNVETPGVLFVLTNDLDQYENLAFQDQFLIHPHEEIASVSVNIRFAFWNGLTFNDVTGSHQLSAIGFSHFEKIYGTTLFNPASETKVSPTTDPSYGAPLVYDIYQKEVDYLGNWGCFRKETTVTEVRAEGTSSGITIRALDHALVTTKFIGDGFAIIDQMIIDYNTNVDPEFHVTQTDGDSFDVLPLNEVLVVTRQELSVAEIVVQFQNQFIALNLWEGANLHHGTKIRWSDIIRPQADLSDHALAPQWYENDPNSLSGFTWLPDQTSEIKAALPLANHLIIYTLTSTYSMQATGDNYIFAIRKLFHDVGCANKHCVVEYGNFHFVVDIDDVYVHDGTTKKSIVEGRVRESLFNNISDLSQVKVYKDDINKEVIIYYTEDDDAFASRSYSWNWVYDKWTILETPNRIDTENRPHGDCSWIQTAPSLQQEALDYNGVEEVWSQLSQPWDSIGNVGSTQINTMLAPWTGEYYMADVGFTQDGKPHQMRMNLSYIDFDEFFKDIYYIKFMRQFFPQGTGEGTIEVRVGHTESTQQPITWSPWRPIPLMEFPYKVDVMTSGRYFHIEFRTIDDGEVVLTGFDFDIIPRGNR